MVWSVCSRARLSWLTVLLYGITLTTSELAATPPRLWSTWYSLNDTMLNETALHSIADTLVSTGMLAAGYDTIMIDDGWQAHHRDADGRLYADPNRFPSGMQAFVQYAADRGLKVGLYTTPGNYSCLKRPTSFGHLQQDIDLWVTQWGVRYIKDCVCNTTEALRSHAYSDMAQVIRGSQLPVLYECDPFMDKPWLWAYNVCNIWSSHDDIPDNFDAWTSALDMFAADNVSAGAGPGSYSLPDILRLGEGGQTWIEYQAQITMYTVMGAALIAGTDLRRMPASILQLYTHPGLLAVHSDPLGAPGYRVAKLVQPRVTIADESAQQQAAIQLQNSKASDVCFIEIWRKPLHSGAVALGVLDLHKGCQLQLDLSYLTKLSTPSFKVLNVWTNVSTSIKATEPLTLSLEPHQASLLVVS
eukprot:TRINITY_DN8355_c0_g1_i3.p1 TRINITY_DN8355_c0_g1~~TRINITY_DN8355_c0_g1_i3.p1  ORF type:complete len:415 (+),score=65.06 TRINITY_DN8355_c0_g1_i3:2-1246(+)